MHRFLVSAAEQVADLGKFLSYVFAGAVATAAEWFAYYVFDPILQVNTYLAVALSFVFSTFVNWFVGRQMTFRHAKKQNLLKELMSVYAASVVGIFLVKIYNVYNGKYYRIL